MTETLKNLITLLRDGQFHSGEQLGKTLGLTRSAIWKLIKQLSTWDLEIESITNKGYRIPGGLTLLEKEKIFSFLSPEHQTQLEQIEIFDNIPSTNDYFLNTLQKKSNKNYACFAEKQTHGKGRRGRTWVAPFAKNIYLSILWRFPQDPSELSGLSLVIAISIIEMLKKNYPLPQELGIKWPNDVLCNHHKLAGILIELVGESNDVCSAVIGVGLNVYMSQIKNLNITQPWTDVQSLTQKIVDRNELSGLLLNELVKTLYLFQNQGFHAFMERWKSLDLTLGKPVLLMTNTSELKGIGRGINEQGHFLLEMPEGIKSFSSGEVSLRLSN